MLAFATGSDRAPIKGLGSLRFVLARQGPDTEQYEQLKGGKFMMMILSLLMRSLLPLCVHTHTHMQAADVAHLLQPPAAATVLVQGEAEKKARGCH